MKQKIVGVVTAGACLFMLAAGGIGLYEIQKEAEDKQAEKEATLEQLDTLKAGVKELEKNRSAYEEGLIAYEEGTEQYNAGKAEYEAGKAEYAKGQKDLAAGKAEYAKGEQKLAAGKAEYAAGMQTYETNLATYNATIANKEAVIEQKTDEFMSTADGQALVDANMEKGVQAAALQAMGITQAQLDASNMAAFQQTCQQIQNTPAMMAQVRQMVTATVREGAKPTVAAKVEETLVSSKQQLDAGKATLDAAAAEIAAGEAKLTAAEKEIAAGEKKLADAEVQLADAEVQLADAEVQLADGKEQLETFEAGQAQVDAGYATVLKNEKIAAKVDNGMEILDAAYEVVDEETVATTDRLMGRGIYLGIAMAGAIFGLIAVGIVFANRRALVMAAIALIAICIANLHGLTRTYHKHELQMSAMVLLAVITAVFTGVCAMKKKNIETA